MMWGGEEPQKPSQEAHNDQGIQIHPVPVNNLDGCRLGEHSVLNRPYIPRARRCFDAVADILRQWRSAANFIHDASNRQAFAIAQWLKSHRPK